MRRYEPACGLPLGGLLPPCISVSLYYFFFGRFTLILWIVRSIDPALLLPSYQSTVGPGLAVVGTPGSPSDVIQTKVLLPRPLDDSVLFIVCLRSVATNQVN